MIDKIFQTLKADCKACMRVRCLSFVVGRVGVWSVAYVALDEATRGGREGRRSRCFKPWSLSAPPPAIDLDPPPSRCQFASRPTLFEPPSFAAHLFAGALFFAPSNSTISTKLAFPDSFQSAARSCPSLAPCERWRTRWEDRKMMPIDVFGSQ